MSGPPLLAHRRGWPSCVFKEEKKIPSRPEIIAYFRAPDRPEKRPNVIETANFVLRTPSPPTSLVTHNPNEPPLPPAIKPRRRRAAADAKSPDGGAYFHQSLRNRARFWVAFKNPRGISLPSPIGDWEPQVSKKKKGGGGRP